MTKALVVALALACAFEARAQEVNGWHRRPPLLQQWQADYDACHAAHTTRNQSGSPIRLPPGANPNPSPSTDHAKVEKCMNAKGWFK